MATINFNLHIFCGAIYKDVLWIRFRNGKGYALKSTPLTFSERYGYTKYTSLPFGWRIVKLEKFEKFGAGNLTAPE